VDGIQNIRVDVRIVSATKRNLEQAIQTQDFRNDLFYRLNEIMLILPPLRERTGDIPLLVTHFIDKYNRLYDKEFPALSAETMTMLTNFAWPGNVRQLENMIKQVAVRSDEQIIADLIKSAATQPVASTGSAVASPSAAVPADEPDDPQDYSLKARIGKKIAEEEKRLISEVLTKTNWNRRKAAEMLQISYRSLLYKIKDYNLNTAK
jgi:transcriptional regulator with PAS, ATPase and Fis domain